MRISLLFVAVFLPITYCNEIFNEQLEMINLEDYFEFTCLQEMSENYMEDFFLQYPQLKPTERADIVTLKRSFVKFLDLNPVELQMKMISGSTRVLPQHKILARFIKGLKAIAEEEFLDLTNAEMSYLEHDVDQYVSHKLVVLPLSKYIKQKKAEFLVSNMSKEEFADDVMRNCSSVSLKWEMDPSYELAEEAFMTPEIEEAIRKFQEEGGKDEMFSIHIDHQTKEKNFKTVKINGEL